MTKKYKLYQYPFIMEGGKNSKKKIKQSRISEFNNTINTLNQTINKQQFINDFNKYCNYPYTPAILPKVQRIIVLGDIHGDYKLALNMLTLAKLIKIENDNILWIGGNTVVVQVGDQIDRCRPMGMMTCNNPNTTYDDEASDIKLLKLFTNLDLQARNYGGLVISLLGNHELMNSLGQLSYVSYKGIEEFTNYKDSNNPGIIFQSPQEARMYAFSPGNELGKFLGCTRLPAVIIGSNLFVHAGIINSLINFLNINEKSDLETINIAVRKWLLGLLDKKHINNIISSAKNSMFWTRILGSIPPNVDINEDICLSHINNVLKIFKIDNIVVGHTPQSFVYNNGINSTCGNKVWRVDNGSSAAFHKFDYNFLNTGKVTESRRPQVLEIINDTEFRILG